MSVNVQYTEGRPKIRFDPEKVLSQSTDPPSSLLHGDGSTSAGRRRGSSFASITLQSVVQQRRESSTTGAQMSKFQKVQFYILYLVEHISVQILSALMIVVDVSLSIWALSTDSNSIDQTVDIISYVFLSYFILEITLRFIGIGASIFIRNFWEMLDAVIIFTSLILSISLDSEIDRGTKEYSRLAMVARVFRLMRLVRLMPQCRKCILSMRLTTSENKQRYREDGFDLDLTYITPRIIAMSFPSEGYIALFRNPIEEVVRFFEKKHGNHYKIYNLCSERDYQPSKFKNSVKRYFIHDHNVASMEQMLDFVNDVSTFLEKDSSNVVAVHCKGGKGRTGSMICGYLMYEDKMAYPTGLAARSFFASQRSDYRIHSKCQGVQTPSQCRFIDYFNTVIHRHKCVIPEAPSLFIKEFIIHNPPSPIRSSYCDLLVEVWTRKESLISFNLLSATSVCQTTFENGHLKIEFLDYVKPCVTGDIKIRFKSNKLPIKYDKASFYFWFNTTFIEGSELYIERELLDNPHFTKYNKVYHDNFGVTVVFDKDQRHSLV